MFTTFVKSQNTENKINLKNVGQWVKTLLYYSQQNHLGKYNLRSLESGTDPLSLFIFISRISYN